MKFFRRDSFHRQFGKLSWFISLTCLAFVVAGCSNNLVKTNNQKLQTFVEQHISSLSSDEKLLNTSEQWWQAFNNTQLNELISRSLTNNHSLLVRLNSVKSAEAQLNISQSKHYPNLTLNSSAATDFDNLDRAKTASLGLSSSWELDLWGRISALEDKSSWELVNKQALYKARANAIAGGVAVTWFNWQAEKLKEQRLAEQIKRTQTALKVIERRYALGKNSVTDIWQQKRLLESIVSQQASNKARLKNYQKQLALWLGIYETDLPSLALIELPNIEHFEQQSIALSALMSRPDIQQAYSNLQADNANLAAAVSERFPRLTLRASYTTNKNNTKALFDDWLSNLVASLTMPIFNSGETSSRIEQREYESLGALAEFKQTWLEAIFEIESRLVNERQLARVAEQLEIQLELAQKTERVTSLKYLNGKSRYLSLLKAQETSLQLERQVIDAQKQLLNNRVAIYRELSHGDFNAEQRFKSVDFVTQTVNSPLEHNTNK